MFIHLPEMILSMLTLQLKSLEIKPSLNIEMNHVKNIQTYLVIIKGESESGRNKVCDHFQTL